MLMNKRDNCLTSVSVTTSSIQPHPFPLPPPPPPPPSLLTISASSSSAASSPCRPPTSSLFVGLYPIAALVRQHALLPTPLEQAHQTPSSSSPSQVLRSLRVSAAQGNAIPRRSVLNARRSVPPSPPLLSFFSDLFNPILNPPLKESSGFR